MAVERIGQRLFFNTVATGANTAWAIVVAFVTLPLLLHGLGSEGFGLWVLLQTFSAVTGWLSLADLGVGIALTRAVAAAVARQDTVAERRTTLSGLALLGGIGAVAALLLATIGTLVFPWLFSVPVGFTGQLRIATLLVAGGVLFDLMTEGVEAALEGLQRVDLSRGLDAVRRGGVAVAASAAALTTHQLAAVAAAALAASVLAAGVAVAALLRRLPTGEGGVSSTEIRALVKYAKPVSVLNASGVLHRTMDRLIVGAVLGPQSVTLVEIATQLQNGVLAVLSSTSYAVAPAASWLHARGDRDRLRRLFERGTRYSLVITLPLAAVVACLALPIIHVWVGATYDAAALLTVLGMVYVMEAAMTSVPAACVQGTGHAGALVRPALLAVFVNVGLSIVLVRQVGVAGAFIGTLAGTALQVGPYLRVGLSAAGSTVRSFVTVCVLPALPVVLAAMLSCLIVLWLPGLGDPLKIVIGAIGAATLGGAVAMITAVSWTELRSLALVSEAA
ncbi:MAG TPA: oligosaccharide flippase family protein [Solirubrobacteraceae bacterium]